MRIQAGWRSALIPLLFLGSCAFVPRSVDVREVREFPECGGWLPVDSGGHVVPQHVVERAKLDGREVWSAPRTRAEAEARVNNARRGAAFTPLSSALMIVSSPLALGAAMLDVPWTVERPDAKDTPHLLVCVVDEHGQPVRDAQLEVHPAVMPMPVHLDATGRRILGSPLARDWQPPRVLIEALSRHCETCFVDPIELEWESMTFSGRALGGMDRMPCGVLKVNETGHRRVDFAGGSMPANEQGVLLFVSAWAPGYEPCLAEVTSLLTTCVLRMKLEPDGARLRDEVRRLREANHVFEHAVGPARLLASGKLDHERLAAAAETLRGLVADASLPEWLRANARVALEEHLRLKEALYDYAGSAWVWPSDSKADKYHAGVERELRGWEAQPRTLSRHYGAREGSPQQLADRFGKWFDECQRLGMDAGVDPARRQRQDELAAQAREMLPAFESLGEDQPHVESLRCVLALHAGDTAAALAHSAPLDNDEYFGLFYGRLREH